MGKPRWYTPDEDPVLDQTETAVQDPPVDKPAAPAPEVPAPEIPGQVEPEFFDLKAHMGMKTEAKVFTKEGQKKDPDQVKADPDDFDPVKPEAKPAEPGEKKPDEPEYKLSYEEQAKIVVGSIDALNTLILPPAYKKKLFTAAEIKRIPECKAIHDLKKMGSTAVKEIPEDLVPVYTKYVRYVELVKDIELSPAEMNSLITPLAGVFQKYQIQAGPEIALIMAVIMVFTPRLSPLIFE